MQQIKIDLSGAGGLAQTYAKVNPNLNYLCGESQTTQGSYNPFVYPGYMSPTRGINKVLTENTATTLNICALYDPIIGKFMTGGTSGGSSAPTINVYTDLDDTTANASSTYSTGGYVYDFEVYQLNGVRKIFFTSFQTGSGYIGVTDMTTFEDHWSTGDTSSLYTGSVTGGGTIPYPPFLRVASNGFMYAYAANIVYKIDGTTAGGTAGTITSGALTLDAAYKISDAADWRNLMFIGVQDSSSNPFGQGNNDGNRVNNVCGVFIWDRVTTQVGQRDFIPLYGTKQINRIFVAHDGKLRMLTVSSDNYTQLREYTGSSFEILFEFPGTASPMWHDSVTTSGYATFWLGQDNYIYCHGRAGAGMPNAIYKLGTPSTSAITAGSYGFLYYGNNATELAGEALFINYKLTGDSTSTTRKILFNSNSTPSGFGGSLPSTADTTVVKNKLVQLPFLCNVVELKVFFATTTSSGTGDETDVLGNIKVYFNQSTTAFKSQNITKKDLRKGFKVIPISKQYINSVQIGIDWSAVTSVGNISGVTNDMMPWYALLEYEQTKARQ